MKTFALSCLLLGGAATATESKPQCKARCGTQVGFTSGGGPDVFISYDGATLTVPQTCREERCGALETAQKATLAALAKANSDNEATVAMFAALSKAQKDDMVAMRALIDSLSAELADLKTEHRTTAADHAADHDADIAAAKEHADAADKELADAMAAMEKRLTPTPHPTPPPTPAPTPFTCEHKGKAYAVGAEVIVDETCAPGCGIKHPCLQKPMAGWDAQDKEDCMGSGAGGNKYKDNSIGPVPGGNSVHSDTFIFQRNHKCTSTWTNWGRPGETFGRTTPGRYITNVLNHIGGHGAEGSVSSQISVNEDRWWICHGSGLGASSSWDFVTASDGAPTLPMEYCMDISLEHTTPDTCIPHDTVRKAPSGQNYKLTSAMCAGEPIKSTFTSSFYGPFVEYKNKGPMANARHSNAEQYFDGNCAAIVNGLDAAKERCRQEKFCGGIHIATADPSDDYCINLGSRRAYPTDNNPQIGHWGQKFETETGFNLWHRQAYTVQDMLRMCESTKGCGCINIHKSATDKDPNYSWSMHTGTALSNPADRKKTEDWSIHKDDTNPTDHPDMIPQPGKTVTKQCSLLPNAEGTLIPAFRQTSVVVGEGACIPGCA